MSDETLWRRDFPLTNRESIGYVWRSVPEGKLYATINHEGTHYGIELPPLPVGENK